MRQKAADRLQKSKQIWVSPPTAQSEWFNSMATDAVATQFGVCCYRSGAFISLLALFSFSMATLLRSLLPVHLFFLRSLSPLLLPFVCSCSFVSCFFVLPVCRSIRDNVPPLRCKISARFTAVACTFMTSSPGPGVGMSRVVNTSRPPSATYAF